MGNELPSSLVGALTDLSNWLTTARIPFMIIGGVAASLLGRPRLTQDIGALAILPESQWAAAVTSAAGFGILPRIEGALEFATRSRVLLMRHTASGVDLDITFGGLRFEESAVKNSQRHDIDGIQVKLPRVEDLLVMKAFAQRPKDLEDIRGLLVANPCADLDCARQWIREFSIAAGKPSILDDFDRILREHRS